MGVDLPDLGRVASMLSLAGKSAGISWAQRFLMPHILEVFADHDHEELHRMILANYPLVQNDLPPNVKQALRNLGNNPRLRDQYEQVVLTTVTPANIIEWMQDPDEWLPEDASDEHRDRIRACAMTIERTGGGDAWLERQVLELYHIAGIVPEGSMAPETND